MTRKWHRETIQLQSKVEGQPVSVVWDAIVAVRGLAGGRMIPLVILDTTTRPDIGDMVRAHRQLGLGDAESRWVLPSRWNRERIQLLIRTIRPTLCTMLLDFDLLIFAGTVDRIVSSQAVYIQPGRAGDRLATTMESERILVEVPAREFRDEWDRIFRKATFDAFRRGGLDRARAKQAVEDFLKEWRQALSTRLKSD